MGNLSGLEKWPETGIFLPQLDLSDFGGFKVQTVQEATEKGLPAVGMTILALPFHFPSPLRLSSPSLFTNPRFISMAAQTHSGSQKTHLPNTPNTTTDYPVPLSPPLPAISKQIELDRAMSASSKSSLFSLSRTDVVYEDDWLVAVNKPQGVYCETVLASIPSLLNGSNGSVELGMQVNLPELHLANRLDRDTSGLMLITKSHKVAAKLVRAFTEHKVRKTYIAFCVGRSPEWEQITIKSGHGRSKFGAWRVYATSDVGRKLPGGSVVRDMQTLFQVLSVNGHGCSKELSDGEKNIVVEEKALTNTNDEKEEILVRACPRSGRTHQIRLHCQYLGIPIRGDVKYEGVYEWKGRKYDGHELHAESLSFEHPITGLPVVLHAPLPSWASQALQPLPC